MYDRQLIADLLSALEYHTEQTRPIEFSKVAIQAAREYLRKPPQRTWVGLSDEDIWEAYMESTVELDCSTDELYALSRTVEAKLKEKNNV